MTNFAKLCEAKKTKTGIIWNLKFEIWNLFAKSRLRIKNENDNENENENENDNENENENCPL